MGDQIREIEEIGPLGRQILDDLGVRQSEERFKESLKIVNRIKDLENSGSLKENLE